MSLASDIWNAMPIEQRHRLAGCILERQIRDYELELKRAKEAHRQHIEKIAAHLENVGREYSKWLKEQETAS